MKNKILKIVVVAFVIASTLATMVLPALADSASLPQLVSLDLTTPESISNYWTFEGGAEYDDWTGIISEGSVSISVPVSDFPINSGLYCLTYAGNLSYGSCRALIGDYSAALIRNSRGTMFLEPFGEIGRDNTSCSFIVSLTEGRAWTYFRGALSEISFDSLTHYSDVSCYFDMHFESVYEGNCILQLSLQELPSSFLYYLKGEDAYSKGVNDSDLSYDYGYEVGYENGYSEGYSEGKDVVSEVVYEAGFRAGQDEGYEEGYGEGYDDGYSAAEDDNPFYVSVFDLPSDQLFIGGNSSFEFDGNNIRCNGIGDGSDYKVLFNHPDSLYDSYYLISFDFRCANAPDFTLNCDSLYGVFTLLTCANNALYLPDSNLDSEKIFEFSTMMDVITISFIVDVENGFCYYYIYDDYEEINCVGSFNMPFESSGRNTPDYYAGLIVSPSSDNRSIYIERFDITEIPVNAYPTVFEEWGYDCGYTDGESEGHFNGYKEGYDIGSGHGFQEGYEEGYDEGKDDGYAEGVEVSFDVGAEFGYESGFRVGKSEGYDHGYEDGKSDGLTEGEEIGYGEGYGKGYDVGKVDGKKEYYNELYEKGLENIDGNQGTGVQGFLAGMWNGTQGFVQELLDGITFSGLSLRSILSTCLAIIMAAYIIRLLKG